MCKVLAIDPGLIESGYVVLENGQPVESGIMMNDVMKMMVKQTHYDRLGIEMVESYGMPVGKEVFETCVWIGRFMETAKGKCELIGRKSIKLHLCGTYQAKDPNIRQAIIDKFGGNSVALAGKKCQSCKNGMTKTKIPRTCEKCGGDGWSQKPGPLYNITSHAWAALGLALTMTKS